MIRISFFNISLSFLTSNDFESSKPNWYTIRDRTKEVAFFDILIENQVNSFVSLGGETLNLLHIRNMEIRNSKFTDSLLIYGNSIDKVIIDNVTISNCTFNNSSVLYFFQVNSLIISNLSFLGNTLTNYSSTLLTIIDSNSTIISALTVSNNQCVLEAQATTLLTFTNYKKMFLI